MEPDSDEDAGYGDLYSDTDSENEEEESGADCGCDGRGGTDNTREQEVAVSGQCQDSADKIHIHAMSITCPQAWTLLPGCWLAPARWLTSCCAGGCGGGWRGRRPGTGGWCSARWWRPASDAESRIHQAASNPHLLLSAVL